MRLDTVAYLASTRVLATWIVVPFLFATSIAVAYIASLLVVVVLRPRGTFALPMWVVVLVLLSSWLFELVRFSIL